MARQVSRDRRASDKDEKTQEGKASGSDSKRRQRADGRRYEQEIPPLGKIVVVFLVTALFAALCVAVVYFTQDRMVNAVALQGYNLHMLYNNYTAAAKKGINRILGLPMPE
ncbi:hypothetical protein CLOM_g20885 [Closterium sp. NIES-68]|nr:hypothetical protein CLOM_g20885 [Closterium sp. NIES-68]GJP68491.1 hypothetical protein CLOP_g25191 [Closterium sp. NIES-67]